jgi:hypothetical protein
MYIKDGSYSYAHTVQFDTGTHDWQRKCLVVDFGDKLVESAHVFLLFSEHSGNIWFDDISLSLRGGSCIFDFYLIASR